MKIFELTTGNIRHFVVGKDEEDARTQGTDPERFSDIHYLPFEVTEVDVPGFTITVKKDTKKSE